MKFEIAFERVYRHSPQAVWQALTDPQALGEWLMETDFAPQADHAFNMWCDDGAGGTDRYICKVLEYEPPKRMLWSWCLAGREAEGDTRVEFRVESAGQGTKVTVTHSGDRDPATIEKFKGGWPVKLQQLEKALGLP